MLSLLLTLVPLTEVLPDPPRLLDQDICDKPTLSVMLPLTVTLELVAV
jgi:hypothetical protein